MIDFIKLKLLSVSAVSLIQNPFINWQKGFDPTTGEISEYPVRGELHNCKIVITANQIIFSGSLHILWNQINKRGRQNWDDFSRNDLSNIIFWLKSNLGINPRKAIIQNLEYGVNINIWKNPKDLINENVMVWMGKPPSKSNDFGQGKYVQWERTQYSIKLYDKGRQHLRSENILRWEKKVCKGQYLQKKVGLRTLDNLIKVSNLKKLKGDLLESFDMLLVVDSVDSSLSLTTPENETLDKVVNIRTWRDFNKKDRSQKCRFRKKVNELLSKHNLNTFHKRICYSIAIKCDELIECNEFTDFQKRAEYKVNSSYATFLHLDNM